MAVKQEVPFLKFADVNEYCVCFLFAVQCSDAEYLIFILIGFISLILVCKCFEWNNWNL